MSYFYGLKLGEKQLKIIPPNNMKEYCDILETSEPLVGKDEIVEIILERYQIDYLGNGDTLMEAQSKKLGSFLGKKLNLRR